MKQLFSLVIAGVLGGLITLTGLYFWNPSPAIPTTPTVGPAQMVNYVNASPQKMLTAAVDFRTGAAKAMPAVVHISAAKTRTTASNKSDRGGYSPFDLLFGDDFLNPFGGAPQEGAGSGVIYTSDGYIVTNNHVIDFADKVEVTLNDNRTFEAEIIGKYEKSDLAVLKIEANDLPTLELANSDEAQVGEWVLAVGNPFDLTSTVTAGIISAKGRSLSLLSRDNRDAIEAFIQTDAAVNPGNSGGALVTADGRLLGINTAIKTQTGVFSGYSFAIPSNLVKRIVDDIIENGAFERAYLGVSIYDLDSEAAATLGITLTQGVVIDELQDGGSAQYAGLQPKDVVVEVNGKEIKNVPELQEVVGRAKVGDVLNIMVYRKGDYQEIPVRLRAQN